MSSNERVPAFIPDRHAWDKLNQEDRQLWADSVFSTPPDTEATIPKELMREMIINGQKFSVVIAK